MTEPIFDHDRLDVYRLSIEYVASAFDVSKSLSGMRRHARDQWLRASQSIPLNIAEGNGKHSLKDRARFFDIARGSSFACAAIQDVLVASGGMDSDSSDKLKRLLRRIVSMLTRMAMKFDGVAESKVDYSAAFDYEHEHEHRDAEHEHEIEEKPEPSRAPKDGLRGFTNGKSIVRPR